VANSGAQWGSAEWIRGGGPIATLFGEGLKKVMPEGFELGQFSPDQSIGDKREAQQFSSFQDVVGPQTAAAVGEGVERLFEGLGLSGLLKESPEAAEIMGQGLAKAMPAMQKMAPGLVDAVPGASPLGLHQQLGTMFRPEMQAGMSMDDALAKRDALVGALAVPDGGRDEFGFGGTRRGSFIAEGRRRDMSPADLEDTDAYVQFSREAGAGMSAVRDLVGPAARGMQADEMFDFLDAATMGGMAHEDMATLGGETRQLKALSLAGDMPWQGAMALQAMAGAHAEAQGGTKRTGAVAGRHGVAFGIAAKQAGIGGEALRSAGTSLPELRRKDALLTAQARNSRVGNQMATLMRMGEEGMLKGEGLKAFEQLKAVTENKEGAEFKPMNELAFSRMMGRSGVSQRDYHVMRQQRDTNLRKYGDKIAGAARKSQWAVDVQPKMQRDIAGALQARSGSMGGRMSGRQAWRFSAAMSETLRENANKGEDELLEAMATKMQGMGMTAREAKIAASAGLGGSDVTAARSGFVSGQELAMQHNQATLEGTQTALRNATTQGEKAAADAPVGQENILERGIAEVMSGTPQAGPIAARLAGSIRTDDAADDDVGVPADAAAVAGADRAADVAGVGRAADAAAIAGAGRAPATAAADGPTGPAGPRGTSGAASTDDDLARGLTPSSGPIPVQIVGPVTIADSDGSAAGSGAATVSPAQTGQ